MSEANQTSDESPVRPVVRRDATIRSEVPARSHEVRPCPLCGNKPALLNWTHWLHEWEATCQTDECFWFEADIAFGETEAEVIALWNQWAGPSPAPSEVEEAE